jgi:hypothetical protein
MIVRREPSGPIIGISQNDHAWVSGQLARAYGGEGAPLPAETVAAVSLHDLASTLLDAQPLLDADGIPLDFLRFPEAPRIAACRWALDGLTRRAPYAALLVSRHYASFGFRGEEADAFRRHEAQRQETLLASLRRERPDLALRADQDFHILQLMDNLSLYLCLNTPGATKDEEHPWFRDQVGRLPGSGMPLVARFAGADSVLLSPFPFVMAPLSVAVPWLVFEREPGPPGWKPYAVHVFRLLPDPGSERPSSRR